MTATRRALSGSAPRSATRTIRSQGPATQRAEEAWELPVDLASCGQARRLVKATLDRWCLADEDVVLVVSELVGNALAHGEGAVGLWLSHDGFLVRVEVRDSGETLPHRQAPQGDETAGRGLLIVGGLSKDWGVVITPGICKTIWAEIELEPDGHSPN